jgi:hypothetical protein
MLIIVLEALISINVNPSQRINGLKLRRKRWKMQGVLIQDYI